MKYEIKKYPDGGCYARITDTSTDYFKYKINTYEDLFMLRSIKDAWDNLTDGRPLNVHIPCMFQQQHDRRFDTNESFELKLVCEFINSCKFNSVSIFHPHNESALAMGLNNFKPFDNHDYYNRVKYFIHIHQDLYIDSPDPKKRPLVLSTDAGSFKWVSKVANQWKTDLYAASKVREPNTGNLTQSIDCSDFSGRDIIVVDDLCVYGGTFVGLAQMLQERNCGTLTLVVSHVTVKNPNKKLEVYFDKIYTSDSKFQQEEYQLSNLITVSI